MRTKETEAGTKLKRVKRCRRASKRTHSVTIQADLSYYKIGEANTATGRKTSDIGDATAELLRGKTLDEVYRLAAKKLGVDEQALRARYAKLNPGMVRMNLGNRMRHAAGK